MNGKIKYGKSVIDYKIIKSKRRKTSQIVVDKDNVIVRTPTKKTNKDIKVMMQTKAQWIFKNQLAFTKQKSEIIKPKFTNNSFVPYKGKNYLLKILVDQSKDSIKIKGSEITISLQSKRIIKKQVRKIYEDWLFARASKYLEARTWKLASKIGIKPSKIVLSQICIGCLLINTPSSL